MDFTTRRVAEAASTSVPAVYELFGDKAGLMRAMFFEGFRRLEAANLKVEEDRDPVQALIGAVGTFRAFALAEPTLFQLMFTQSFTRLAAVQHEVESGGASRDYLVDPIRRCQEAGVLEGNADDIAHSVVGLIIGLATQEIGGWLGGSRKLRDRRWDVALAGLLRGFESGSPSG